MKDLLKVYFIPRLILSVLLTAISFLLLFISRNVPHFANWYCIHIYETLVSVIARIFGLVKFSVVELCLYLTILIVLAGLIRMLIRHTAEAFFKYVARILLLAASLFLSYTLCCGINYARPGFSAMNNMEIQDYSPQTLVDLCVLLTRNVIEADQNITRDKDGIFIMDEAVPPRAKEAMENLGKLYPSLDGYYPVPKPLTWSPFLSYQHLTGIYSPFTIEANYNNDATPYNLPLTACHELSHLRGFMLEREANFLGYLACLKYDDPDFTYSGALMGWLYASNQLYRLSSELYSQLYQYLPEGAKADLRANSAFWKKYEGPVSEAQTTLNDTYLKAHRQEGVSGYDRMVDLMVAYYRAEGLIE